MVDQEDARLQGMGLTKLNNYDLFVEHEDEWDLRNNVQNNIKTSNLVDKKPVGNIIETSATSEDRAYVSCNLPTVMITIKAETYRTVAGKQVKKEIDPQHDWAVEEVAEWSKEFLTADEITIKEKHLSFKHASDPETYSVPNYFEYIPKMVRSAEKKYRLKFFNKNKDAHDWLRMAHIKVYYVTLKCNLPLVNDQKIQQHYRKIHLLSNGASSLTRREIIKVNPDLDFKITDLTNFENLSIIGQNALIDKVYNHVVVTGVFENCSSRNGARINKSRSTEFINEMKKVCQENYFERFKFSLKSIIKKSVSDDFVCSWENIETAMLQAVGGENKVNRIYAFRKIKPEDFHSKPMEIIFTEVDSKIDQCLGISTDSHTDENGRSISPYSFSTYYKYILILGIIENLEGEFCQVKDHIEQKISKMFDKYDTLQDIPTFQEELITEFNTKNIIKIFRTKDVPKQTYKPQVNNSGITEKKNETTSLKDEFRKKKVDILKDLETAKELVTEFIQKTNGTNKDSTLGQVSEVTSILKGKKWRICFGCVSSNCQLIQNLCKTHKTPKRFLGRCTGKKLTLGEMPETLKNIEDHIKNAQKKSATSNTAVTSVQTPAANNYTQNAFEFLDSNPDILEDRHSSKQTRSSAVVFSIKLSNLQEISEENLPEWRKMKRHRKYTCVICGKRKLYKEKYDEHLTMDHILDIKSPSVSEYQIARNLWTVKREQSTPEELKTITCDYNSDTGKRYSEEESESESYSDDSSENDEDTAKTSDSQVSTESPHFSTGSYYSSDSDTNSDNEDEKEALSLKKYEEERRKSSNIMENRFNNFENTIEKLKTVNDTLKIESDSKEKELHNIKKDLNNIKSTFELYQSENLKTQAHLETLLAQDTDSEDEEEFVNAAKIWIEKLESMIITETENRILSQKKLEERFSKLETKILAEKSNIESIIKTQHNLEVAVNDNYTI